jgi:hypothetical protein
MGVEGDGSKSFDIIQFEEQVGLENSLETLVARTST